MTYGYDDVTGTTMSVQTEVQLNAGTSLTAPDPAHGLLAVIPYAYELGAFTVDQSLFQISTQVTRLLQPYKHRHS